MEIHLILTQEPTSTIISGQAEALQQMNTNLKSGSSLVLL